ncbi:hypothetical protein [Actinomadura harenae]|uniref:hypothetical protein n=1 Tax=Actinomadura harenae TaxID=2483351 RepID=UPI0013156CA3|nr:hypothetical protein [Actinomadura harenae]
MKEKDQFSEFVEAVDALRDDDPVRVTAHTSNASAHGWNSSRSGQAAEAPGHDVEP